MVSPWQQMVRPVAFHPPARLQSSAVLAEECLALGLPVYHSSGGVMGRVSVLIDLTSLTALSVDHTSSGASQGSVCPAPCCVMEPWTVMTGVMNNSAVERLSSNVLSQVNVWTGRNCVMVIMIVVTPVMNCFPSAHPSCHTPRTPLLPCAAPTRPAGDLEVKLRLLPPPSTSSRCSLA